MKIHVMRCGLASCRGGRDGCNGSECRNPKWDKMSEETYNDLYGTPEEKDSPMARDIPPAAPPENLTEAEKQAAREKGRVAFRKAVQGLVPGMDFWVQDGMWEEAKDWVESWQRLRESVS